MSSPSTPTKEVDTSDGTIINPKNIAEVSVSRLARGRGRLELKGLEGRSEGVDIIAGTTIVSWDIHNSLLNELTNTSATKLPPTN